MFTTCFWGIWLDGDPNQENVVQKILFFDQIQDSQFFMAYLWRIYSLFMNLLAYLWINNIIFG